MKKKLGFTLIELLAVIVILAVIAIIAVPVILGIIDNAKFKKYKIEEGYIKDAAKLYYASKNLDSYESVDLQTLVDSEFIEPVVDFGNNTYCEGKAIEISDGALKGCLKCSNYVTKGCGYDETEDDDSSNTNKGFPNLDNKCVVKNGKYYDNNGKLTDQDSYNKVCKKEPCGKKDGIYYDDIEKEVTKEEYLISCKINLDPEPCSKRLGKYYDDTGKETTESQYNNVCNTTQDPTPSPDNNILDTNPGVICGNNSAEEYDSITECHIKSVEDLVEFTKMVNIDGYDFTDHIVYLDKDLNITETSGKSYVNPTKTAEIDVNSDSTTSSIKEEMTTGKGFLPVGSSTYKFNGTFDGQANTIKNLMINRSTDDNVGLFGYIGESGKVVGLILDSVNVTGHDNTGALSGTSEGTINEIVITGSVSGNDYVGGAVGLHSKGSSMSILSNTNVTGNDYVYGLSAGSIGVVAGGTITGNSNVFKSSTPPSFVNEKVQLGTSVTTKGNDTIYHDIEFGNLNIYDSYSSGPSILDTYLGGDNDSSGYYFDYDSKGNIVLKSTKRNPIDTTLKGGGTKENPYLIYTANDMKKIAAMPTENNYYLLMNDIDFKGKKYYMIGIYTNPFVGTFEGGAHTLKNIEMGAYQYAAPFGYVSGTPVFGLNISNVNVEGIYYYASGLVGTGGAKEVVVSGKVTSPYVGGVSGNSSARCTSCILRDFDAVATNDTYAYVNNGNYYGMLYESGSVTAKNLNTLNYYVSSNVKINVPGASVKTYPEEMYSLEYPNTGDSGFEEVFDSWLGGDSDGDGYYFDYGSNGKMVLRSTKTHPINTTLTTLKKEVNNDGGTKENPYLIYTANDMKKIAAMPTEENYYLLMNDIDFKDKKYYTIGTNSKPFRGTFEGGAHTLKNISVRGSIYKTGLFLSASGGSNSIFGLNIENVDLIGQKQVMLLSDFRYTQDISITGNITACYIKDGSCYNRNSLLVPTSNYDTTSILVNANTSTVGGIYAMGGLGIYEAGSIKAEGGTIQANYGGTIVSEKVNMEASSISNDFANSGNYIPADKYNDLEYYGNLIYGTGSQQHVLETKYSGDVNNNGYWFDYNADKSDIVVVKADKTQVVNPETEKPNPDMVYEQIVNPSASVPECKLNSYENATRGFTASYTCTDKNGIVERKHIYWVRPDVDDYNLLIRWQPVSKSTNVKTDSTWTESSAASQGIDPPYSNNCYYFYYGAKNQSGNSRMYRSQICKQY